MNDSQIVKRKIFLKRQAVSLIKAEVWDLRTYLLYLQMKSLMKRSILWFFNHGFLNLRATQNLYNIFRLRAD